MKQKIPYLVAALIALAIFGFAFTLFTKPGSLISGLAVTVIIAGVIYLVFTRATGSSEQRAYKKAARQSKRQKQPNEKRASKGKSNVVSYSMAQSNKKRAHKRKSDVHLTVIEGKKGKKNRA